MVLVYNDKHFVAKASSVYFGTYTSFGRNTSKHVKNTHQHFIIGF